MRYPTQNVQFSFPSMSDSTTKVPKKRASTPRSKKGCITCKIRRLKCGEERPGCVRCAKSGWTCDGYQDTDSSPITTTPSSSSNTTLTPLLPRSSSTRSVRSTNSTRSIEPRSRSPSMVRIARSPSYTPQTSTQLEQEELQYFQTFVDENSVSLVLGDDSFFWKRVAILESASTPCIRHALVALGALMASTQKSPDGTYLINTDSGEGSHRQFALHQHEKAIRGLREAISRQTSNEICNIIIACLVLVRLEPFIGNGGFAMQHVRYARKLIFKNGNEGHYPTNISNLDDRADDPNEVAMQMFLQSDMQALAIMGAADEDRSMVYIDSQLPNISIPASFRDIREAKRYHTFFCGEGLKFWYQHSLTVPGSSWDGVSDFTLSLRDHIIHQLHLFLSALTILVGRELEDQSCHPLRRPSSLKLNVVTIIIALTLTLDSTETSTDLLQPYFQYIVNISREVLDYEARFHQNSGKLIFTFEPRIVLSLFVVGTKCREPTIRRQAISLLLSSHRREMMLDSLVLGSLSNWIMAIEEEGMDMIGFIPEESRAWGNSMSVDLRRNLVIARTRVGRKAPGQWVERMTELPGQFLA